MQVTNPRCEWRQQPVTDRTTPRLTWELSSTILGDAQTAYQVQAGSTVSGTDLWDTGKVTSSAQAAVYAGSALTSRKAVFWRVRTWDAAGIPTGWTSSQFEIGLLSASDWGSAVWIGYQTGLTAGVSSPAAHVRKAFVIPSKAIARARLYASALGLYRPYLNGSRVGQDEFAPGWTDYTKRRQYQTYDVTSLVVAGATNALGMALGDGWYQGVLSVYGRNYYGADVPRGLCILYVDFTDGSSALMVSDGTWKALPAANQSNDIYNGSPSDARAATGFTIAGFDDSALPIVSSIPLGSVPLVAQPSPAIRRQERLLPIARTSPASGVYVFDFGQNHSGIPSLSVSGAAAGQAVRLRHAEDLANSGSGQLYTGNLRTAAATDTLTCIGSGTERFEPLHTWHGYRYVEVTGYPGVPPMNAVSSSVVHMDTPEVGRFSCSSPLLTRIWQNARWTLRSNALAIPTDCNQRDERLGWTNDAMLSTRTATFLRDSAAFLDKFCSDIDDSTSSGRAGDIAPYLSVAGRGSAAWGEAGILIPWTLYQVYGDTSILSRHYANMQAILGALPYANTYGDYLNQNDATNGTVFTNAWAYRAATVMQQIATVLGDSATASTAATNAASYLSTLQGQVASDGTVTGNSQSGYILGLAFGFIPTSLRAAAFAKLVALIGANGLTCGFVGLAFLYDVLADNGRLDLAYSLALNTANPSLGYEISQGMTTTGENWNSPGIQGSGDQANSYNHPVRSCLADWLMRDVAGIDIAAAGYAGVLLRPRPGGGLTWANGTFDGPRGKIESKWSVTLLGMQWRVIVPANTTATLVFPPAYTKARVSGATLSALPGATSLSADPATGGVRWALPSGTFDLSLTA